MTRPRISLPQIEREEHQVIGAGEIFYEYAAWPWLLPVDRSALAKIMAAMQAVAPATCAGLWLVNDNSITSLNQRILGCVGPTNILSFPDAAQGGTLVLSLDACAREAWLYGQDRTDYLIRLLAHGFGHLPGYEHGPELDAIWHVCAEAAICALENN